MRIICLPFGDVMPAAGARVEQSRGNGMPPADRNWWIRLYADTASRELPWSGPTPYPPLVRAVKAGWLNPSGPVLDVGCGLGANLLWLATQGFRGTGIDLAPGAIAAAESRRGHAHQRANFQVDDILASRLPARTYLGAIDVGCFQTLPPRTRSSYASNLARVLRSQAAFLLFWVAREERGSWGPPHRLSVNEVIEAFEPLFLIDRVEYRPRTWPLTRELKKSARPLTVLAGYTARLVRRSGVQPPPR